MADDGRALLAPWSRLGSLTVSAPDRRVRVVTTPGGDVFILKHERAAPAHLDMLRHLHDRGVAIVLPLPTDEGHPFATVAGHAYTLTPALPHDDHPPDWTDIGVGIGRLHRAAASFTGPVPTRMDLSAHAELAALPVQAVHGDCHLGNILTVGGKLTGFVDFDELRLGPRPYDLAYLLAGRPHEEILPAAPRLLAGYHAVNPLRTVEREAMVAAMLAVEMIFMDWFSLRAPDTTGLRNAVATHEWIIRHRDRLRRAFLP